MDLDPDHDGIAWPATAYLAAAAVLGFAIHVRDGEFSRVALALVWVAMVLTALPVLSGRLVGRGWAIPDDIVIRAWVALQFIVLMFYPVSGRFPWDDDLRANDLRPFRAGVLLSGMTFFLALRTPVKQRTLLVSLFVATHLMLAVWTVRMSPAPFIDTFIFERDAAEALLDGRNPYAITMPDIYGAGPDERPVYGEGMVVGDRVRIGYPYPPLSLLLETASQAVAGDVRYAHALALAAAGALLIAARPSDVGLLAAALFLFTPRGFFVLGRSWTEPVVATAIAAAAWSLRRRPRWGPLAIGVMLATKQYLVLLAPLLLLNRSARWRSALIALGTAAAVLLPFVLWDPGAFYRSVIHAQLVAPPREDGLTFFSAVERLTGVWPPAWVALAIVLLCLMLVLWRAPRDAGGFFGGASLLLLVFFAFNKHAFANYYYGVIAMLCAAAVSTPNEGGQTPSPSGRGLG